MLARISGILESLDKGAALVAVGEGAAYEVLVPAFLSERLAGKGGGTSAVGQVVVLHTLQYMESLNQGSSFVPRLIGFASVREREFFELLTSVKGLGNKRALRAMAMEPGAIARAIHDRDTRALQRLPEIGPKLAELIVHELKGKAGEFAGAAAAPVPVSGAVGGGGGATVEPKTGRPRVRLGEAGANGTVAAAAVAGAAHPPVRETVEALIALGENPGEAERMVARAVDRAVAAGGAAPTTTRGLLTAAYAAR
ncbi:MAG: hypothetical protein IT438_05035 [Phycisphaerales bacterium]|nr:hypothetical protein [Phycisphaerales bacterium]